MDIQKIDRNFMALKAAEDGFVYCDVREAPLALEGLPWKGQREYFFCRTPASITQENVSEGVVGLSHHTSGACVRFRTNSKRLQIRAELGWSSDMNHMPRTGSSSFDAYRKINGTCVFQRGCGAAPADTKIFTLIGENPAGTMEDWLINFPLYGGARSVEIGFEEGSAVEPPAPHRIPKPVLFYGSSITQGGCASRPGNNYTSHLCRAVDAEQINLGFSGNAKGELAMAELIASLDLSCFVYDYDHNAPSPLHLANTHEKFFQVIRAAHPDLPVIALSKGDLSGCEADIQRRNIVKTTVDRARAAGDKKIWFIDGKEHFGSEDPDACTVDGCHPNDLGFYRMYRTVLPVLKEALWISD